MKYIVKLCLVFFLILFSNSIVSAASGDINLVVSPIKYEINADPGDTITKSAKIINKSNVIKNINTGKANFISNNVNGQPIFVRNNTNSNQNTELASWIQISTQNFDINPGEEKYIDFTITVPQNATPGGHYGAVFFKYEPGQSSGKVSINADYGVLVLVTVSGNINSGGNQGNVSVNISDGSISKEMREYLEEIEQKKDNCKIDLTKSDTDGKCVDKEEAFDFITEIQEKIIKGKNKDENKSTKKDKENNDKKDIIFSIPFENNGNTHIKPKGKITIKDETGEDLKSIGKKQIKDEMGKIIGEDIVDYLPINEQDGNILPDTKRVFESSWEGFLELGKDESGKNIIKSTSAEDYFSKKYSTNRDDLYPWERICKKIETKNVKAIIHTSYKNHEGKDIEFNSAKDIKVKFTKKYIGINPYFFILLGVGLIILWLFWLIIFGKRKKKCKSCKKKIPKKMKICPYCEKKQ